MQVLLWTPNMQGNANWLPGFLFSISCFLGWSIWTELLCSTSLRSVECQCSGTTVSLPSWHRKSTASIQQNVGLFSKGPPATPSMDFHRWNTSFCVCFCPVLRPEPRMSASSPSLTQHLLLTACISVSSPPLWELQSSSLFLGEPELWSCHAACAAGTDHGILFHGIPPGHRHLVWL